MLLSRLRSWLNGHPRPTTRRRAGRPRGYKPSFEALEDRAVPATLRVTTTADGLFEGTLRQAIVTANQSAEPDTPLSCPPAPTR